MSPEELEVLVERRKNLQIGDLVLCPQTDGFDMETDDFIVNPAYAGLVIERCGHKVTVLGGTRMSWDGVKGRCTWDIADLTLLEAA